MAEFLIRDIKAAIDAEGDLPYPEAVIEHLLLDSRRYRSGENYLFFALRGSNHNGHRYIPGLYKKGIRSFVVEDIPTGAFPGANFLKVTDTLQALQKLAGGVRENSDARIIAITGSNGKTIVKEWLYQILHARYRITRSPKSYNSQTGVPLSVWELKADDDLGIFEAGISQPGEMEKLQKILNPQIGIFTNIGSAHDENFKDREQKIREKLILFKNAQKVICCSDHSGIRQALNDDPQLRSKYISWSETDPEAALYISLIAKRESGSTIQARYKGKEVCITIPFTDSASVENAIHCWLCALELGEDPLRLQKVFCQLQPVAMRLEMKAGRKNAILISDIYNSDLESLDIALNFLDQQAQLRPKVLVLSDILQSGLPATELYNRVSAIVEKHDISELVGIGPAIKRHRDIFKPESRFYDNTDSFLRDVGRFNWEGCAILLKGARSFHFEDISRKLEHKSHETVLEIHLSRLVNNLNYFRSQLQPGVRLMAMVKAFSYGSGSYEIASLLEFHQVDYLSVAYTDEGVDLRKAGISLPVMVLNPEQASFDDIIEFQLEPEIYSLRILEAFSKALDQNSITEPFPIHLKLDTGMHRLGFEPAHMEELIIRIKEKPNLKIASVFSHLAAADDPGEKEFTERQIQLFREMTGELEEAFGPLPKHILNSAGISNYPQAQFDMVRLGIGLYGITSNPPERENLLPISELKATVSQVKHLQPGDTVGYGMSFRAPRPMTIATITIGYADGLRRSLSNGTGEVWIKGGFYPVVGRVCMDMTMVDVTHSPVEEGDEVEVFGTHISIYDLAQKMETIPYEVLTGISQRVKRVYFME